MNAKQNTKAPILRPVVGRPVPVTHKDMTISTHHGYIVRPRPSPDPPPVNPVDLGLPEKFGAWRDMQWDVVQRILDSRSRFVVICAPVGSGKSLAYMAASV